MGILDALNYSGQPQGGGLLDFLRTLQQGGQQQFNAGLPSDQAQYDAPPQPMPVQAQAYAPAQQQSNSQSGPLDNAQWPFGPNGAPSQAMAQAPAINPPPVIPAQPAQMAPPASPGMGDRFTALAKSVGHPGGILQLLANGATALSTGELAGPAAEVKQEQNLTMRALLQKGVDPQIAQAAVLPGNTELRKTLFDENFKAKTPMNLGSGYIYKPGDTKATRLFEPDEKTPAGFVKDDSGNMKFVPGGPADPAYIQLSEAKKKDPNGVYTLGRGGELYKIDKDGNPIVVHKNEAAQAEATLDEPTVKAMASQYLAGDKSVMQNLGRGAQGAANIVELRKEIYKQSDAAGQNAKDIVNIFNEQAGNLAGQRSIGTRAANISLAANEANNMIPIALKASEAVPRTQYMPLNQAIQQVQKGQSSPELARFVAATNSLVNAYVRAVSPSGVPTDSMREHAYSMLNSAQSHQAYQAVTSIMQDEMKAALTAPGQVRQELRNAGAGRESQGPSGDAIYAQAKDAIARGAPREKVLERLRQNGVDSSGL